MCKRTYRDWETGGGQAQGVGLPSTTPTMARIQAQGMGAQLQNILSQVELNKAVAKKTDAEANKIKGVDTQQKKVIITQE